MQIEHLPISNLRPYAQNARTHSKRQIQQIANSIRRFGFCNPVLIDKDGQIIAGHGRVEAAKLLTHLEVPVVRLDHLSEAEKRAYILADNRLAQKAGWDKQLLALELQYLVDLSFDVELTGFEPGEIDVLFEEMEEQNGSSEKQDHIPPYSDEMSVTQKGDVWLLGKHRIHCGDSTKEAAYRTLMNADKAEMIFTDPPYNVPIDGHVCGLGRIRHRDFAMGCGEMSESEFTSFLREVFEQMAEFSVDGSIHQICMDWRHMKEMLTAGHQVYTELKNVCVWNKNNAGMGTFYRSKHEMVFVWKYGSSAHINNFELGQFGRFRSNVWDYAGVNSFSGGRLEELSMHPTVKPVALVADALRDCSNRNGIVLDPFGGSGTTLLAAERTGRKARLLEIDPRYVDVTIARWQDYSGRRAILSGTEKGFEDIREERQLGDPLLD